MVSAIFPFLRKISLTVGILCLLFSLMPVVFHGIFQSEGIIALLLAGALLVFLFFGERWQTRFGSWWPWFEGCCYLLTAIGLALSVLFTILIVQAGCFQKPPDVQQTTLVVLGCKIKGDRPSLMLQRRLDTAYRAMSANPSLNCVVSGGQGSDEEYPESQVMRSYLIEKGIAPQRILEENRSRNTKQNLEYSMSQIRQQGWKETVTIVTDAYHQYRAGLYAQQQGITAYHLSGWTSWDMVPAYTVREFFAILKFYLLEHV